jgi:hypothetical protein
MAFRFYGVDKPAHLLGLLLKGTTFTLGLMTMGISIMATPIMTIKTKVQRIQELRRSNAAQPVRNKKKYFRKIKHKRRVDLTSD